MKTETKIVQGQLIGLEGRESVPIVTVEIIHQPESEDHKYIASLTIKAYKTDIDGVGFNLKLGDDIEAHVMLHLAGSATEEETKFVVALDDPFWKTADWFGKL